MPEPKFVDAPEQVRASFSRLTAFGRPVPSSNWNLLVRRISLGDSQSYLAQCLIITDSKRPASFNAFTAAGANHVRAEIGEARAGDEADISGADDRDAHQNPIGSSRIRPLPGPFGAARRMLSRPRKLVFPLAFSAEYIEGRGTKANHGKQSAPRPAGANRRGARS